MINEITYNILLLLPITISTYEGRQKFPAVKYAFKFQLNYLSLFAMVLKYGESAPVLRVVLINLKYIREEITSMFLFNNTTRTQSLRYRNPRNEVHNNIQCKQILINYFHLQSTWIITRIFPFIGPHHFSF